MRQNSSRLANNFQDWKVGPDYEIKKSISHGSFQKAVEALHISTKKKVIIAKFRAIFDDLHQSIKVLRELILYRKANHPNLLKIIDIIEPAHVKDFNDLYVVFEYMMSDIAKILKSPIHLEIAYVQHLLYHILATLKYLHSSGLVHRDLKPCAILLNEDCSIKICGFEFVKTANEIGKQLLKVEVPKREIKSGKKLIKRGGGLVRRNLRRELCGVNPNKPQYRAPDVLLLKKSYTSAIDVWSVGCIFADLLNMIKDNAPTFLDRSYMFYGEHTVPLSPSHEKEHDSPEYLDYLRTIFSVVGTPKPKDLEFMGSKFEIEEIGKLPIKKSIDFAELFPVSEESLDLLKRMLEVNPDKRITIDECFYHPFLRTVCKKEMESSAT